MTLALVLLLVSGVRGFIDWAVVRASFANDPEMIKEHLTQSTQRRQAQKDSGLGVLGVLA